MRRLLPFSALIVTFLLVPAGAALASAEVEIGDDGFDPRRVEVDVREPIVWTNATDEDVSLVGEDPSWESGAIEPGATFSIHITQRGTYTYGTEDGALTGEIVVGGGGDEDEEATEAAEETDTEDTEDAEVTEVDPDEDEGLPETGMDATVPGALSILLVGFGAGLLVVTEPRRRLT